MNSMEYFRRFQLVGKNLTRNAYATIRGTVRRADPAGGNTSPYFPGVIATNTLVLDTDGGVHTISITSTDPSIASVIADINTGCAGDAIAFDADGTIAIRSNAFGGKIGVTGGTASALLGFNTREQDFRSVAGDIDGSSEGRNGNQFGTALPGRYENWDIDSFNRAMGRLAANQDVLYSEAVQEKLMMRPITGTLTDGSDVFLVDPSERIYTGYGVLDANSTPAELASYFAVSNPDGTLSHVKVIGVVNGAPGPTPPPYVDTASYAAADGGNALGLNLLKTTHAITAIHDGRHVECIGATFNTNIMVGDIVEITAATNLNPWSNNGMRWIVESVVDDENINVRPMSLGELTMYGVDVTADTQPILELNTSAVGSLGTMNIYTGTWWNGLYLVLSACIYAPFTIWACTPAAQRPTEPGVGAQGGDVAIAQREAKKAVMDSAITEWTPGNNSLVTGPSPYGAVKTNNGWVVVGSTPYVARSTFGTTWANVGGLPMITIMYAVAYDKNNSILVTGGVGGKWYQSADNGVNWTTPTPFTANDIITLAYDPRGPTGAKWMATCAFGEVWVSENAVTWTAATSPFATIFSNTVFDGINWIATQWDGVTVHAWFSNNGGTSWTDKATGLPAALPTALTIHNRRLLVGFSGNIYSSDNSGTTWVQRFTDASNPTIFILLSNNMYVVAGMSGGKILVSADGTTWAEAADPEPTAANLNACAVDTETNRFVLIGGGKFMFSNKTNL